MSFSSFVFPRDDSVKTEHILDGEILNADVSASAAIAWSKMATTGAITATSITLANTGLHLLDTNASHDLIIAPGSDLTADRTLTLTTGDADRTLTLSTNVTLDQDLQQSATPTFAQVTVDNLVVNGNDISSSSGNVTITPVAGSNITLDGTVTVDAGVVAGMTELTLPNTGLHLLDTNASHDLIVAPGSDLTADRTLTLTTGDADRTVTLSGNLTVESASLVNQDLTSDATPTFAGVNLGNTNLDDYVEGTFTPTVTADTVGDLSVSYTTQSGVYTRIGNTVHFKILLVLSTVTQSTAAGNTRIGGLPITSANEFESICTMHSTIDVASTAVNQIGRIVQNATYLNIESTIDNDVNDVIPITSIATGDKIELSGTYFV